MDKIQYYNKPFLFYFLSTAITWFCWLIAGKLSHMGPQYNLGCGVFLLIGLTSPAVVGLVMIQSDHRLRGDFFSRLFSVSNVKKAYLFLALSLMPLCMIVAQLISLLFGYSLDQFSVFHETSFSTPILSVWIVLFLAPVIEEMAWHSYGTDCLYARYTLFITCLLFSLFWAVWHIPLSFVKGYYQSNLVELSWVHVLNFSLSIVPFVFIMNWLYYRSERSILVPIIFHASGNASSEIFATHPDTKIIFTMVLMLLSIGLIYTEKALFFNKAQSRLES